MTVPSSCSGWTPAYRRSVRRQPLTEGRPALAEDAPNGVSEWAPCHCCGLYYMAANMVHLEYHPDDAICVGCVAWLYDCRRPIVRRLYPIWRLPARIRAWITPNPAVASTASRTAQAPDL